MISIGSFKFSNLDRILIVDKDFTQVYNSITDDRISIGYEDLDRDKYVNRNLFEIYPSLKKENSSMVRSITKAEIVVKKFQKSEDINGRVYLTHNITIPLVYNGKILGAVELVKDVTTVDNVNHKYPDEQDYVINPNEFSAISDPKKIIFDNIIAEDTNMLKVIEQAKIMSKVQSPTLIYGETGTGKEVLVQAMINYSGVSRDKIVVQNCAAIPPNLIESILFGTNKGAYTGAENRNGLFEEANEGIIFLDEINSIPYDVQGKLLRVLENGSFRPVGLNKEKTVNVKIIAAMNVDPIKAIEKKEFRRDLFYRLSGGMIFIPPLRDRRRDIKLFIDSYIKEYNIIYGKEVKGISKELENFFSVYEFDGNVRELKHIIESMVGVSEDEILELKQLPAYMYNRIYNKSESGTAVKEKNNSDILYDKNKYNLKEILREKEVETINKALKIAKGNRTKTAEILGIPRQTLKYKIDKYNIKAHN